MSAPEGTAGPAERPPESTWVVETTLGAFWRKMGAKSLGRCSWWPLSRGFAHLLCGNGLSPLGTGQPHAWVLASLTVLAGYWSAKVRVSLPAAC